MSFAVSLPATLTKVTEIPDPNERVIWFHIEATPDLAEWLMMNHLPHEIKPESLTEASVVFEIEAHAAMFKLAWY